MPTMTEVTASLVLVAESMERYTVHHIEPGSFLRSVLENDLRGACDRADHVNQHLLVDIMRFVENTVPHESWGSPERVAAWLKRPDPELQGVPL